MSQIFFSASQLSSLLELFSRLGPDLPHNLRDLVTPVQTRLRLLSPGLTQSETPGLSSSLPASNLDPGTPATGLDAKKRDVATQVEENSGLREYASLHALKLLTPAPRREVATQVEESRLVLEYASSNALQLVPRPKRQTFRAGKRLDFLDKAKFLHRDQPASQESVRLETVGGLPCLLCPRSRSTPRGERKTPKGGRGLMLRLVVFRVFFVVDVVFVFGVVLGALGTIRSGFLVGGIRGLILGGGVWEGGVYEDGQVYEDGKEEGKEEGQGESNRDGDAQSNGSTWKTGRVRFKKRKWRLKTSRGRQITITIQIPIPNTNTNSIQSVFSTRWKVDDDDDLENPDGPTNRTPMTTTTSSIAFWTADSSTAPFLTSREHTATSTTEMNPYRRQQTTIRQLPLTTLLHTTTTHDAQDNDSNTARELRETTMNNDDHEEYNIYDLLVIHRMISH
ncbi:hypothetical protein F5880DRAFT_1509408 [Lentinula raphanica]|nr:hypothetical protein F5880DRAFT_1509408 [Lentinula raphanica]